MRDAEAGACALDRGRCGAGLAVAELARDVSARRGRQQDSGRRHWALHNACSWKRTSFLLGRQDSISAVCSVPGPALVSLASDAADSPSSMADAHFIQLVSIRLEEETFYCLKGPPEHRRKAKGAYRFQSYHCFIKIIDSLGWHQKIWFCPPCWPP